MQDETDQSVIPEEKPIKIHRRRHKARKEKKSNKSIYVIAALLAILIIIMLGLIFYIKSLTKIAATVNGEKITYSDVESQYSKVPKGYRLFISKDQILDQIIQERLLMQEAKKQGIIVTDNEAKIFVEESLSESGTDMSKLDSALKSQNLTFNDVIEFYKLQLTITKLFNKTILSKVNVSDEAARMYYELHKNEYDRVKISHILVNSSETASMLKTKIVNGADFGAIARNYSLDTASAINNGSLGYIKRTETVPQFEEAAFALDINQVSNIVKTQFGYHLIKSFDKKVGYEAFKDIVEFKTKVESQKPLFQQYVDDLRSKADIKIYMNATGPVLEIVNQTAVEAQKEDRVIVVSNKTVIDVAPNVKNPNCIDKYSLPTESVIYYYSDLCDRCVSLKPVVDTIGEDYTIFYAEKGKPNSNVVSDCFKEVNQAIMPQFICVSNGNTLQGTHTEVEIRAFAAACK